MAEKRKVVLSEQQHAELLKTCDHAAVPSLRQRAAAIIKVSEGASMTHVGKYGLLRKVRDLGVPLLSVSRVAPG